MRIRTSRTATIILIAFLIILIAFGLYFGVRQFNLASKKDNFVDIPLIQTSLKSSSDGKSHTLEATFTLDVTKFKDDNMDQKALYNKIASVVNGIDYDALSAEDGTKHIKEEIAKNLEEFVEPEDLNAIYITNIISDAKLQQDAPPDRKSDVFKGLFKNIE